ncbi:hypothetical protein P278_14870 [Zhouia amylolytica AD3]|uniref:Uncharacterized protein n=1 Tax=Zhouia amylolytica AD3 TaxID=1286632 RepID=W2UNP8_9FLAO|nr:hypothetical protein P278_14870 [Zhouia amylolytica AD3]
MVISVLSSVNTGNNILLKWRIMVCYSHKTMKIDKHFD